MRQSSSVGYPDRMTTPARIALAAVPIVVMAVILIVMAGDRESAGPELGTMLQDVLAEPDEHLGETVTVSGEVARLDPIPAAFTIGDRVSPQENELFVLPTRSSSLATGVLESDSVVRVEGTIRRITRDAATDDGLVFDDEEDDALDEFEGELAIEATRIDLLQR